MLTLFIPQPTDCLVVWLQGPSISLLHSAIIAIQEVILSYKQFTHFLGLDRECTTSGSELRIPESDVVSYRFVYEPGSTAFTSGERALGKPFLSVCRSSISISSSEIYTIKQCLLRMPVKGNCFSLQK